MSTVIIAKNISKAYHLGEFSTGSFAQDLHRWLMKRLGKEIYYQKIGEENNNLVIDKKKIFWSLKDINFEINKGECIGIIGKNGAGKSTLLKILSQITTPTTGELKIKGKIASLLEVGTGFHPDLTGRENIFLNGAILGMSKNEIKNKFDEIVNFASVERYIDTPVKRYSSGMYVRLAFAVAAYLESDILIVDEVLAVGDFEFQKKCLGRMNDITEGEGRTVLFVSHNMSAVSELCSKAMFLENGTINQFSDVDEVINQYVSLNKSESSYLSNAGVNLEKDAYFDEIKVLTEAREQNSIFFIHEPILISFKSRINRNREKYTIFCTILNHKMIRVFSAESECLDDEMILKINPYFLVRGKYSIHAFIHIPRLKQEDVVESTCHFEVIDNHSALAKHGGYDYGSVFGNYVWVK